MRKKILLLFLFIALFSNIVSAAPSAIYTSTREKWKWDTIFYIGEDDDFRYYLRQDYIDDIMYYKNPIEFGFSTWVIIEPKNEDFRQALVNLIHERSNNMDAWQVKGDRKLALYVMVMDYIVKENKVYVYNELTYNSQGEILTTSKRAYVDVIVQDGNDEIYVSIRNIYTNALMKVRYNIEKEKERIAAENKTIIR